MTPYHHGDLRRALVDEALRQIGARGIGGWSLREVAAALGVSHAAPYHHFRGRGDLVAAVAADGLERLDALMAEGQRRSGADPLDELLAIGMAYVQFAVERPDYFAAIEAASAKAAKPESRRHKAPAPGPTWLRLIGAVEACQRAGRLPGGDPIIVAVSLWSLVHGLAELWKAGPLTQLPEAAGGLAPLAERVLRAAVGRDSVRGRQPSALSRRPVAAGPQPSAFSPQPRRRKKICP
jgi:AcrR family transcriptional regulator